MSAPPREATQLLATLLVAAPLFHEEQVGPPGARAHGSKGRVAVPEGLLTVPNRASAFGEDASESFVTEGASLLGKERELVQLCLDTPNFNCCRLRFGLEVRIGGRSWTEGTFDHFWQVASWFTAVETLLVDGERSSAGAIVWDQSALGLERDGSRVTMSDANVAQGLYGARAPDEAWMPVSVSLEELVFELANEGRILETLRQGMLADIQRRGFSLEQLQARLQGLGDRPDASLGDAELCLAILARELDPPRLTSAVLTLERADPGRSAS
ncbi:hypothetical protein [Myxococcus sp. CA040A]|uniref:hypothetical protein n=1 Tax=Myxococcus sp. CA040A TaxID=2741738 RepID=UPI00157A8575|nr:hypothetical protein [Myxococcus sp. CA040A]NTX04558.1 hypothetical protein [Myxococcus sp. CA040A]